MIFYKSKEAAEETEALFLLEKLKAGFKCEMNIKDDEVTIHYSKNGIGSSVKTFVYTEIRLKKGDLCWVKDEEQKVEQLKIFTGNQTHSKALLFSSRKDLAYTSSHLTCKKIGVNVFDEL